MSLRNFSIEVVLAMIFLTGFASATLGDSNANIVLGSATTDPDGNIMVPVGVNFSTSLKNLAKSLISNTPQ